MTDDVVALCCCDDCDYEAWVWCGAESGRVDVVCDCGKAWTGKAAGAVYWWVWDGFVWVLARGVVCSSLF